jgi:hypothetical protein
MSPSPDKEPTSEVIDSKPNDTPVNPKKRSSSDAVEYPRRRATIAVRMIDPVFLENTILLFSLSAVCSQIPGLAMV